MPPSAQPPTPQTFAALVRAFTSFLTVSIHTILYQRSLYPRTSFLTARAYNTPVHQSRHPAVCTWIADVVAAITDELYKNAVSRIVLVIYGPTTSSPHSSNSEENQSHHQGELRALERYVWDVSRFPVVASKADRETAFAAREDGAEEEENVDLEEQFRAALTKLNASGAGALKPLPPHCTFTVAMELKDEEAVDPPIGHPQPWIPVQPSLQAAKSRKSGGLAGGEGRRGDDLGGAKTTPVRAVRAGEMMFEMWIEEGKAKLEMERLGINSSNSSTEVG